MIVSHVVTALAGSIFFIGWILVWLAGWFPGIRRWMEAMFTPGEDFFDSKASYASTVTIFRWWGWLIGPLLVLPTFIVIDIFIAAVTILLWIYIAKKAKKALEAA